MKLKQAVITSVLVAGLAFGSMGSAFAAKGGNGGNGGKGGGKETTPSATLSSSCTPSCVPRETIYFTGEGYDAAQGKALLQVNALWTSVGVADDGTVDFYWGDGLGIPGEYTVQLYQNGKGNKLQLKAETTVTIQ